MTTTAVLTMSVAWTVVTLVSSTQHRQATDHYCTACTQHNYDGDITGLETASDDMFVLAIYRIHQLKR